MGRQPKFFSIFTLGGKSNSDNGKEKGTPSAGNTRSISQCRILTQIRNKYKNTNE